MTGMQVHLIAHTTIVEGNLLAEGFLPDPTATEMDTLGEFAGRACYQSFDKPNPATRENRGYLANITEQKHFSLYRHASATFYVAGVSRSLTHELVVHKHLAHSQLSQRYCEPGKTGTVVPPALAHDDGARWLLQQADADARKHYEAILARIEATQPHLTRKQAREAARSVLPNMTETRLVVTGNLQAWRQFIAVRHSLHADAEIRELAGKVLEILRIIAPNSVQDVASAPAA